MMMPPTFVLLPYLTSRQVFPPTGGRSGTEDSSDADTGFTFTMFRVALGVVAFLSFLFLIRLYVIYRRRRANMLHPVATPVASPSTTNDQQLPPPSHIGTSGRPHVISVPTRAVYISGRNMHLPNAIPDAPGWSQIYPQHVVGARSRVVTTEETRSTPRFNPEDLVSMEVSDRDKGNPCPICLGALEEEPVSTGQCLHLMHSSCLKSWLAKDTKSACPVCRVSYVQNAANQLDAALEDADSRTNSQTTQHQSISVTASRHRLATR
ncbi:unnamed protein product [Chondrus crispus]|uniref:RING-type domain-containing protein n=1 Tax=Chondrus crispus TaxID=2769 RepID=R7QEA0_CHOCR|nr:unnamed protein product [Chondrus crispus]CDF36078.1 unnamed protein product [Chondrus crispus]|eukprot:XP_005715897.1 unnamed protein product [Chondrus crispus]